MPRRQRPCFPPFPLFPPGAIRHPSPGRRKQVLTLVLPEAVITRRLSNEMWREYGVPPMRRHEEAPSSSQCRGFQEQAQTIRRCATTSWLHQRQARQAWQAWQGSDGRWGRDTMLGSFADGKQRSKGTGRPAASRATFCLVSKGMEVWKLPTLVDRVVPRFHRSTRTTTLDVACTHHVPCTSTMYRGSYAVAEPGKPWILRGAGAARGHWLSRAGFEVRKC